MSSQIATPRALLPTLLERTLAAMDNVEMSTRGQYMSHLERVTTAGLPMTFWG